MNPCRALALAFALPACATGFARSLPLERIRLPPGFEISIFTDEVPGARSLAVGKEVVFVGTLQGRVYGVRYQDARATEVRTIASGLNTPNGVALKDAALYIAEISRVIRLPDAERRFEELPRTTPQVVFDRLPNNPGHGWKFIRFGPDGLLYVPVGAPCNVCEPDAQRYANIGRLRVEASSGRGSGYEIFARGVRNSVGFDWDPETHELWFTDNGRDELGDDLPSDELNHAWKPGMNFGFPYCHQGDTPDPRYGKEKPCSEFTPPAAKLGAHVAALGMRFYTGSAFPAAYRRNIFIAEHGSWNRKQKNGYRIQRVIVDPDGKNAKQEVFAGTWLDGQNILGRPADILVAPDGSLLIADDQAGAIYQISYSK